MLTKVFFLRLTVHQAGLLWGLISVKFIESRQTKTMCWLIHFLRFHENRRVPPPCHPARNKTLIRSNQGSMVVKPLFSSWGGMGGVSSKIAMKIVTRQSHRDCSHDGKFLNNGATKFWGWKGIFVVVVVVVVVVRHAADLAYCCCAPKYLLSNEKIRLFRVFFGDDKLASYMVINKPLEGSQYNGI